MKLKIAILGSGNIGTDLMIKAERSPYLECSLFIGRNEHSKGMQTARDRGIRVSNEGIQAIIDDPKSCDLVFDATSAKDHIVHSPILERLGKAVIDMTPSHIGKQIIPAINIRDIEYYQNVNMVSCGGQASIPLAHLISTLCQQIDYIEVVSSIASDSAGPATRINIDEYIENTEAALRLFTGCPRVKTILILNPAKPCINMQTTISLKIRNPDIALIRNAVAALEKDIQRYVPGYHLVVPPVLENNRVIISVRVKGLGDYLPSYAGNLDIINCAAIATAEAYTRSTLSKTEALCQI
jgi:acetaldehyde dehydrogenase (acetylating)